MKSRSTRAASWLAALLLLILSFSAGVFAANENLSASDRRMMFRRGAQLWPIYCNTCHNARPGPEFSPAEWNMIMMHMRAQANLTGEDARAILEYLKESR